MCLLTGVAGGVGAELCVAPGGSAAGPGTPAKPYDLATALSGRVGRPGDTFWLRGGTYSLGYLDTQVHGRPGRPITFRQMAGERARIDGSVTLWGESRYVVFRDFELYSSDTNRVSCQRGVGFKPTDIHPLGGFSSFVPDISFINLVVHDATRHAFYLSPESDHNLIYGCIIYNNGFRGPDNGEGYSFYVQGNSGIREISDTISFNNVGFMLHVYSTAKRDRLDGVIVDGNVGWGAGALQDVRIYRDWVVGVDPPALSANRIVFKNNMGYKVPGSRTAGTVQMGRGGVNGSLVLANNYMPLGLLLAKWQKLTMSGNLFLKGDGRSGAEKLKGTKVFVRPNRYEAGRANIVVYNWDNLDHVAVDVSKVLAQGQAFEVRNAQDFFAAPVLTGTYNGQSLSLPMNGLSVAKPNGNMLMPPATGPTFNVFVLLPLPGATPPSPTSERDSLCQPTPKRSSSW